MLATATLVPADLGIRVQRTLWEGHCEKERTMKRDTLTAVELRGVAIGIGLLAAIVIAAWTPASYALPADVVKPEEDGGVGGVSLIRDKRSQLHGA